MTLYRFTLDPKKALETRYLCFVTKMEQSFKVM